MDGANATGDGAVTFSSPGRRRFRCWPGCGDRRPRRHLATSEDFYLARTASVMNPSSQHSTACGARGEHAALSVPTAKPRGTLDSHRFSVGHTRVTVIGTRAVHRTHRRPSVRGLEKPGQQTPWTAQVVPTWNQTWDDQAGLCSTLDFSDQRRASSAPDRESDKPGYSRDRCRAILIGGLDW
jgi:hypothetical protein